MALTLIIMFQCMRGGGGGEASGEGGLMWGWGDKTKGAGMT